MDVQAGKLKEAFIAERTLSERPEDPHKVALWKLLGARVRVTLDHGRKLIGDFDCLDDVENMILSSTVEYRDCEVEENGEVKESFTVDRYIGLVTIRRDLIRKFEIDDETWKTTFNDASLEYILEHGDLNEEKGSDSVN